MRRILFLFLLVTFSALTAQAGTKEDIAQLQRSLLEIQQQFWDLEERLKNNNSVDVTLKGLQDANENLRETQASLNAKMERILNEVQALNGRLEETNQRVRNLSLPVATSRPQPTVTTDPPQVDEEEEDDERPASPRVPQERERPTGRQQPAPTATIGEQQLYQDAMGQYTKGRFEQALRGFQDLLDQFPGSRMSDDAQYMIGESYYGMKEYVDAVSEYDKVIKGYPDSDLVPGARLKKAFSLFSLGKKGQGVIELQQISDRYPETKEADIARQRLEELGLE